MVQSSHTWLLSNAFQWLCMSFLFKAIFFIPLLLLDLMYWFDWLIKTRLNVSVTVRLHRAACDWWPHAGRVISRHSNHVGCVLPCGFKWKKVICEVECTLERINSIYHLTINIVQHICLFIFNKWFLVNLV